MVRCFRAFFYNSRRNTHRFIFTGSKKKSEEHLLAYVNLNPYSNYSVSYGGNELFVGRAGYLLGAIWLEKELQRPILGNDKMNEICRLIIDDGKAYAVGHESPSPLMYAYYNTEYIGKWFSEGNYQLRAIL